MLLIQLTGLSGAGKTSLASAVKALLLELNYKVEIIDGDEYRQTLCKDLGFSKADRMENIRRLSTLGAVLVRNDVIAIMAAINPYESVRQEIKSKQESVHTVWIHCDLDTLIRRDTKGLYRRAMLPEEHPEKIRQFTGIDDPFEPPEHPDLIIDTAKTSEQEATRMLFNYIIAQLPPSPPLLASETVWSGGNPKALFIGRWQPFHNGHQWIIEQKIASGIPVLIAIRDIAPDEKNPLSAAQTFTLIQTVYAHNPMVSIMVIPDIESVNYGRNVGYEVNEIVPPTDISAISATDIRQCFQQGSDAWKSRVHPAIYDLLERYLSPSPPAGSSQA